METRSTGSCRTPSISPRDDLRLADGELEALAAHLLDEDRQLELAAALHLPGVGPLGREDAQRDVADELGLQPALDHARRQPVALQAGERRRVDPDRHRERRLVHGDHRQRPRVGGVGERLADRHLGEPGDGDDLPRPGLVGLDAVERLGHVELGHLRALDRAVGAAPGDRLRAPDRPLEDAAEREAADVGRGVEVRHERLQRVALVVGGRRDALQDHVEQRLQVGLERVRVGVERGPAGLAVAVDDRELDLALVGVQVEEELVHLVDDRLDARVRPVDLVDDEDHRQPRLERLAQHEARLRQRPLARVDEQEHAVDHRQPALDLAAEVGVARRVDDVDLRPAVADGRVLGEDRDALLALEVAGVEHALGHVLVRAEGAGLPEQRVDERGLAVVDVRDDGDVADVRANGHRLRVATRNEGPGRGPRSSLLSVAGSARAVPGADATLVVVAERARPADHLRAQRVGQHRRRRVRVVERRRGRERRVDGGRRARPAARG